MRSLAALALFVALISSTAWADAPSAPAAATHASSDPPLESTGGGTRRLSDYRGHVVVLVYEDRHSNHQNDAFKSTLAQRAISDPSLARAVSLVAVADLRGLDFWPAQGFARDAVFDAARAQGLEILMDWRGELSDALQLPRGQSTIAVLSPDGFVRYVHHGRMSQSDTARFFAELAAALGGS